jgi:hypothetical protein
MRQCCESGSGIRCLYDPWIRDRQKQDPDPRSGSGMNNLDHISESLETNFRLKYLNYLIGIRDGKNLDLAWEKIRIRDPATLE